MTGQTVDVLTAYGLWHYWIVIFLMMTGLYIVIARDNLVKKVMGLNIFQSAVIMFYVAMGKVSGGTAPIWALDANGLYEDVAFSNPVPHVLMLTAIVVGVATTALALHSSCASTKGMALPKRMKSLESMER